MAQQDAPHPILRPALFANQAFPQTNEALPLTMGRAGQLHRVQFTHGTKPSQLEGIVLVGLPFDVLPLPGLIVGVGNVAR